MYLSELLMLNWDGYGTEEAVACFRSQPSKISVQVIQSTDAVPKPVPPSMRNRNADPLAAVLELPSPARRYENSADDMQYRYTRYELETTVRCQQSSRACIRRQMHVVASHVSCQ